MFMRKKTKILLIDDEEDFCYFVRLNLEKTGRFDVYTALNGHDGIAAAKAGRPDVILLDILMPEMDGSEVAQRLQELWYTKTIPIVFLTALVRKEEVEESGGVVGGHPVIAKPVTPDELINAIELILERGI
jgi:CheY-like chemotaxis protein